MKRGKLEEVGVREKRGQVTIFVIIAMVIVFAILFYLYPFGVDDDVGVDSHIRPVYDVVSDCVHDVGVEAINVVGSNGGYYDSPPEKVNSFGVSYFFSDGEKLMPGLDFIEGEMEDYTRDMVSFCVQKKMASMNDYDFYSGDVEVDVDVRSDDKVYFKVDYPFSVLKDNKSYYFDSPFEFSSNVRLFSIYEFISKMMDFQAKEPRAICMNCISDLAMDYGLYVDMMDILPNDVVFFVHDDLGSDLDESYFFLFTVKYPEENNYDPFENL